MCRSWTDDARSLPATARSLAAGVLIAAVILFGSAGVARAGQFGSLVSPGPLARAHAMLEGATRCQQCHEAGRKVTATRCLTCHKPIADRIASGGGVHRKVTECVSCHVEHAGAGAELRHIETRTFNHAAQTGFALDGVHAKTAAVCSACHKARSFLEARPACSSCHIDVHKGSAGAECMRCHSTAAPFKQARSQFDHATARFPLAGAHREVACEKCHKTSLFRDPDLFRGREVGACAACHTDPHRSKFGAACASCHTTDRWVTRSVDHSKTRFPLVGAHGQVACAKCHQGEAMTRPVPFGQCASCHVNVHRESVKEDCRACHTQTTFRGAAFDHAKRTGFALEGKHEALACIKCHTTLSDASVPLAKKVVDYRGARSACVSCHGEKDPHKGAFGRACDSCHRPASFSVKDFRHPQAPDFYGGQHEKVACEKCHVADQALQPLRAKAPSMACASCHGDVHLGQLGIACERCHSVAVAGFAAPRFSHEQSRFPLTGRHQSTECAKCHVTTTRAFPSRTGTAVAFSAIGMECRTCHKDPHLGQVDVRCETCHQTTSFAVPSFAHRGMDDFFGGFHGRYACAACHKKQAGVFPSGPGTAVQFTVGRTCASCHRAF